MGSMYQLDSLLQDLSVSNAAIADGQRGSKIFSDRPIISIEYDTDVQINAVKTVNPIQAWVFDKERQMDWTSLDGPVLGFLRVFAWYDMTIGRFSNLTRNIIAFRSFDDEIRLHMELFTDRNQYTITGKVNLMGDSNYLGAIGYSRTTRPGETWTRGRDLADGSFSKSTWDQIVMDMLSFELIDPQSGKKDKIWGLFPDDEPGQCNSHERRLGYQMLYHNSISDNVGNTSITTLGPLTPYQ